MQKLSIGQVVTKGIWQQRWMQIPIALGVAAATAIIVGALIVGDSVRTSLRDLALDRLGKIDYLLMAPRFFDESTIEKWKDISHSSDAAFPLNSSAHIESAILFPRATVEKRTQSISSSSGSTKPPTDDKATQAEQTRIAGGALCFGIDSTFWSLGSISNPPPLDNDTVILNKALAEELSVSVGDRITIRLPSLQAVPADSPLGKRDESTVSLPNLRIIAVLPTESLARFDLRSNQRPAKNIFVSKSVIQSALDRPDQINAAFISANPTRESVKPVGPTLGSPTSESNTPVAELLLNSLPLSLNDLGYSIKPVIRKFPELSNSGEGDKETSKPIIDYLQITSDQLLIPDQALTAIDGAIPRTNSTNQLLQRTSIMAYLANAISKVESTESITKVSEDAESTVPYSTIVGIDPDSLSAPSVGFNTAGSDEDLENWSQSLSRGELLVTDWLAKETKSQVGDTLRIYYFAPETVDGTEVEKHIDMKIGGIVKITTPSTSYRRNREAKFSTAPTQFNDPEMVPKVPGITDQESMSDWDLPFALTRKIRPIDDEYWNQHRLTPKLYMSLKDSQKLFGSRFGSVSSIRLASMPGSGDVLNSPDTLRVDDNEMERSNYVEDLNKKLLESLRSTRSKLGWNVLPLREQQLAASKGTTPFDALFLALSMFVIVSALLLVSLLFRLSIERRSTQWGLLKSIGFSSGRIQSILRREGLLLSMIGAIIGMGLGVGYGYTVIELLKTWWIGAVGTPFLDFHAHPRSLIIGSVIGVAMAWLTIFFSARFVNRQSSIQLLKGNSIDSNTDASSVSRSSTLKSVAAKGYWLLPLGVLIIGLWQTGPAAAGAFVGGGMLMLLGLVVYSHKLISRRTDNVRMIRNRLTLISLAKNSVRRNPWRSVLAIGLMAVATFLVLSISLFEASPDEAGTGGFDLLLQSTVAIPKNLASPTYQRETLGDRADILASASIIPMRVRDGDDAGCSNLYQASQPQVLGISPRLKEMSYAKTVGNKSKSTDLRPDFAWAAKGVVSEGISPWAQLEAKHDGTIDSPLPVILDQNTALWALHLTGMPGEKFHFAFSGRTLYFKTVAVLQNTILQGSLLIGESNFESVFPEITGYRLWLVRDEDSRDATSSKAQRTQKVAQISDTFESGWSDEGMDAASTDSILKNLLAVQNTYLKAFQSLGGLGLLLGTFGLAVVQMRSVQERRAELGLMKAMGWSETRLGKLLMLESMTLLSWGIGIGVVSAFFAILPTLIQGSIPVGVVAPAITMIAIFLFGLASAIATVRSGVHITMLNALRSE